MLDLRALRFRQPRARVRHRMAGGDLQLLEQLWVCREFPHRLDHRHFKNIALPGEAPRASAASAPAAVGHRIRVSVQACWRLLPVEHVALDQAGSTGLDFDVRTLGVHCLDVVEKELAERRLLAATLPERELFLNAREAINRNGIRQLNRPLRY